MLEKEFAGFGASGRNGGWLSAELAGSRDAYASTHGHDGVVALMRAMRGAVDEVIGVTKSEGIDADIVKDGVLHVARNQAQMGRLRESLRVRAELGCRPRTTSWSSPATRSMPASGSSAPWVRCFTPHCARVQPAKLVQGLARVVEGMGVAIYEQTEVTDIKAGRAITARGDVRAPVVLRCLESFTATMPGQRRAWLPMNSSMVVTEPLPDSVLQQVGWKGAELLGDYAHGYMYAQRTADNRIALGGRGDPYRYGSALDHRGATQQWTIDALGALVRDMFPATRDVQIEHAWCGVLGVPRDWTATVDFDRASGLRHRGRLCRQWPDHHQPGRAHPCRSRAQARHRAHPIALGGAPRSASGNLSRCGGWGFRRCTRCTEPLTVAKSTVA